jgi:glycosyltransferase involved in cell wall biosynthesis
MDKNLNVLISGNSLGGGGAERVMAVIANELARKGHNVHIICITRDSEYYTEDSVNKIYIDKLINLKNSNNSILSLPYFIRNEYQIYKLYKKAIKEVKPDVVVSFTRAGWWELLYLCRKKIPLVFSEHTTFCLTKERKSLRDSVQKRFLKYGDAVTVLTKYDYDYLGGQLPNKVVMYNPLSFEPLNELEYRSTYEKRKNLFACGRVGDWHTKGFDNLIKSFGMIASKHLGWDLDIAGWGKKEDEDYLYSIADKYNIRNRIHFLGFRNDVEELMKTHSILIMSSRSEGFPMSLTEAMSMGCPPVSFDIVTGPREIINNGIDGIIVENQNCEALALGMERMIVDEEFRKEAGLNAIRNIKRFSAEYICTQWENLFYNLLEQRR